jgi:hypothetical protein
MRIPVDRIAEVPVLDPYFFHVDWRRHRRPAAIEQRNGGSREFEAPVGLEQPVPMLICRECLATSTTFFL